MTLASRGTRDRMVLVHADGSMGVLPAGTELAVAQAEADECNVNERDPRRMTRVHVGRVVLGPALYEPAPAPEPTRARCPRCGWPDDT